MPSICEKIQRYLEDVFSMPFNVSLSILGGEAFYSCFPENDMQEYFTVTAHIKNSIRIVVDITPQIHSAALLHEFGNAAPEKKEAFITFVKALKKNDAKVKLSVNNAEVDLSSSENIPLSWNIFTCRVTKAPLTLGDEDDIDEFVIVSEWIKLAFCLMFSLLTIVDKTDYDIVTGAKEGDKHEVVVNKYERNPINREICLAIKGYACNICGFDFEQRYGVIGKSFIHVHHLIPVSKMGPGYVVNIEKDLIPVCPNCHAMMHRKDPPYTPEEIREFMSSGTGIQ